MEGLKESIKVSENKCHSLLVYWRISILPIGAIRMWRYNITKPNMLAVVCVMGDPTPNSNQEHIVHLLECSWNNHMTLPSISAGPINAWGLTNHNLHFILFLSHKTCSLYELVSNHNSPSIFIFPWAPSHQPVPHSSFCMPSFLTCCYHGDLSLPLGYFPFSFISKTLLGSHLH